MNTLSRGQVCSRFFYWSISPIPRISGRQLSTTHRCLNTKPLTQDGRPFRMAVIGSGPAGFYTSYKVTSKIENATVDMYEHLPTPFGLVRYGVAPDHPEVKFCQEKFQEVAESPNFNFIGNMAIGDGPGFLPLTSLAQHYDAILFAYGASKDRQLGIPGEDNLKAIYSARAFVGWYNGLPEYTDLSPDLHQGEEAIVIGQGNVAMDVARILLGNLNELRKTDITEQAVEALSRSRVKSVRIVGRRGPSQAAFTIKELRELITLENAHFTPLDPALLPPSLKAVPRPQRRILELLQKGSPPTSSSPPHKSWSLDFCLSPTSFNPSSSDESRLGSLTFNNQTLHPSPHDPQARPQSTQANTVFQAQTAFRSIGYKSTALPGLSSIQVPFDEQRGVIPNDGQGRVLIPGEGPAGTSIHVPGMYCAGWVKRGPTGVIASTMNDAFATADVIAEDWSGHAKFLAGSQGTKRGWDALKTEAEGNGCRRVSWEDWMRIDRAERERGRAKGKEREKFVRVGDMLAVID